MNKLMENCSADRAAWLEARKQGIGSSDISEIAFGSPLKVYLSKIEDYTEQENDAMYFGRRLEAFIAEEAAERLEGELPGDIELVEPDAIFERNGWMLATPDRFILNRGETIPLECKNTGHWFAEQWEAGLPDRAHTQVMWQMHVLGLSRAYVAALIGGNKFSLQVVHYDKTVAAHLEHMASEVWQCVKNGTPPDPGMNDADLIGRLYPREEKGKGKKLDDSVLDDLLELQQCKDYAKELEARLKNTMKDAEIGYLDGEPIITWKTTTSNRIDTKALKEAHPELVEQFIKTSTSRRFTPKWTKLEELRNGKH